jgi:hypothetical protein
MPKMLEIAYSVDITIQEFERKVEPTVLLHSIVAAMESDEGLKSGLEMANRTIKKVNPQSLDGSEVLYESSLTQYLIKVLDFLLILFRIGIECTSKFYP